MRGSGKGFGSWKVFCLMYLILSGRDPGGGWGTRMGSVSWQLGRGLGKGLASVKGGSGRGSRKDLGVLAEWHLGVVVQEGYVDPSEEWRSGGGLGRVLGFQEAMWEGSSRW